MVKCLFHVDNMVVLGQGGLLNKMVLGFMEITYDLLVS